MAYSRVYGAPDLVTAHATPIPSAARLVDVGYAMTARPTAPSLFDARAYMTPRPQGSSVFDPTAYVTAPMAVHSQMRAQVPEAMLVHPAIAAQASRQFGQLDDDARREAGKRILTLVIVVIIAVGITYYLTRLAYKKSPQESAQRLSTPRLARNLYDRLEKNKRGNHQLRRSLERLGKKERRAE